MLPMSMLYGDLTKNRLDFVHGRIADIKAGKKVDAAMYQDGYGRERKWTQDQMEGKAVAWSVFNPMSWLGYGALQDVSVEPSAAAPKPSQVAEATL